MRGNSCEIFFAEHVAGGEVAVSAERELSLLDNQISRGSDHVQHLHCFSNDLRANTVTRDDCELECARHGFSLRCSELIR